MKLMLLTSPESLAYLLYQSMNRKIDSKAKCEVSPPRRPVQVPLSSAEALYKTDRKGDRQNLKYGSIDKYQVPKYRTAGYGRLIGLDRRFRITSDSGFERSIDNNALDPSERSHGFSLRLKQQSDEGSSQVVKFKPDEQQDFLKQRDYIAFENKRRKISNNGNEADRDMVRAHEPIDGSITVRLHSDSVSESEASGAESKRESDEKDAFEAFKNHPDNKKHIELRSLTERNPQNVSAWLDLIEHQERYFLLSSAGSRKSLNVSQKRTVADMKVSLYEKAIDTVKGTSDRQKLILGLMQEGSHIWDTNKQLQQWKLFLQQNRSIELWYEFLSFQQSNAIAFSYERCLETFAQVQNIIWSLDEEDHDYHSVYVALRLTTFMHEAGFTERAIAIWQGLLEYNILRPKAADTDLQAFEPFWESECPRIGEEGAKGWVSAIRQEVPTRADHPLSTLNEGSLFLDWSRAEAQRSSTDIMPARTLDDTIEDDPYRVMLFSDIKQHVFQLRSAEGKIFLRQAFLKFCGLPPMRDNTGRCRKWWADPFLCEFQPDLHLGTLADTTALFATQDPSLSIWNISTSIAKSLVAFAVRALAQLAEIDKDNEQLAEYAIALQLSKDPKAARKLTKRLLKHRSDSILLYNAYALVELRNNKPDVADNVWSTALSMTASLAPTAQQHKFVLWHSWIWEFLERRQHLHALNLLVQALPTEEVTTAVLQIMGQDMQLSSGQHLRADAYLREGISNSLAQNRETIVELTSLLAILKYLQGSFNLDAATNIYQTTLLLLNKQNSSGIIERLHQLRARFLHLHARSSTSGYRPVLIASILEQSLMAFPDNSLFLTLHERYLRRAGTMDRVRLHDTVELSPTSPMTLASCSIFKELSRPLYSGSTAHSVRRAFTNATAMDSRARCCSAIWLLWLQWEASLLSAQMPKVDKKQFKDVYLSALRCCPWRKDLYLQSFLEYDTIKATGEKELEQVYRSMCERGLRVRHDITEILDSRTL